MKDGRMWCITFFRKKLGSEEVQKTTMRVAELKFALDIVEGILTDYAEEEVTAAITLVKKRREWKT